MSRASATCPRERKLDINLGQKWVQAYSKTDASPFASALWTVFFVRIDPNERGRTKCVLVLELPKRKENEKNARDKMREGGLAAPPPGIPGMYALRFQHQRPMVAAPPPGPHAQVVPTSTPGGCSTFTWVSCTVVRASKHLCPVVVALSPDGHNSSTKPSHRRRPDLVGPSARPPQHRRAASAPLPLLKRQRVLVLLHGIGWSGARRRHRRPQ